MYAIDELGVEVIRPLDNVSESAADFGLRGFDACARPALGALDGVEDTWGICTRAGKLYKARSRMYRSQIVQANSKYSCESSRQDLHNAVQPAR